MASKRHLRRKSCEGKVRYTSQEEAGQASRSLEQHTGSWINAYKCEFCGHWHIGHPTKKKKQALIAKGYSLR